MVTVYIFLSFASIDADATNIHSPAEGLLRAIRIAAVHALRLRILESPNVWGGVMRLSPFCARLWLRACAGAHSLLPVPLDAPLKAFACSVGPTTRFDDVLHIQVVKCPYDEYNTPEKAHMAVALLSTRLSGALGCWPACLFDVRRNNLDLDLFEDDADVPPLFAVYFSFPLENIWTEHKIADQMRISLHHIWILDQVNGAIGANVPFPAASNYSLKPVRMPPFSPIALRVDRCASRPQFPNSSRGT
ncbi:hypothetical protein B0H14DRAFT_2601857 [Mycena olivaceomarginata]|nr:hypothetical protein B0H14DRAFT_2601857 [Mycena olivaceomarginata]